MSAATRSRPSVQIVLPLTDEQAKAVVRASRALGVEPWELGAYALAWRQDRREGRALR